MRRAVANLDGVVDPANVQVEPILNWGGFVNRSFRVSTPLATYCLKLSSDPDSVRGLQQWRTLRGRLEDHYLAPRMLDWIDVPDLGYAGPLFEWVQGTAPTRIDSDLAVMVSDLLQRLHTDEALTAELRALGHRPRTCAQVYLETLHERFTEDLKGIVREPPPFVTSEHLRWMRAEVDALEQQVRSIPEFQALAESPVHGDIWLNNILATPARAYHVIDWDGLGLGDPAADWAIAFGPSRGDLRPATARDDHRFGFGGVVATRFALWARATSLDWVIDPLADWVEAGAESEHGDVVRSANQELFPVALEAYLTTWGR